MRCRLAFSLTMISLLVTTLAKAHHAIVSTYNPQENTAVQGVVTRFLFKNPHARVYFNVTNADGSVTQWVGDGSASTILRREGWTAETLEPGDFIQIIGSSSRDGSPMVMMDSVSLLNEDGTLADEIYGSVEDFSLTYDAPLVELPKELQEGIPNLSGIWLGQGSPYTPPRGVIPAINEAGAAAYADYDFVHDPQVFCDTPGIVRQAGMTPHGVKISQLDDRVVFEYEEYGVVHEAYLNAEHPDHRVKTHFGDSIARYEKGTLVVETINLLSEQIHAGGYRLSDEIVVIQTYQRVDEPNVSSLMKIHTLVKDPLFLEEDFELENIKIASQPYEFLDNECVPPLRERQRVNPAMNFFFTSVGVGDGANLAGLAGADTHCAVLAGSVAQSDKQWRAYLSSSMSTVGEAPINARDRIGNGPWYNAKGDVVAVDLDDLHSEAGPGWTRESVLTERGVPITGQGDDLFYCFAE
ncbi:MAG: hypothetical protein KTR16_09425 [Acidiferrobacterales bacterium]|nr:hypothetical protein [Acidiferrobacterales bacterium]